MSAAGKVVLVTGVSRDLGRRHARALAGTPGIDRVIGVDVVPPRGDIGDVSFVRADIRTPVIAKVIAKEDVDTVVHMSVIATPGSAGARGTMKELNVIGTMQLLAACQKSEQVRQLVVKSSTTAYGASSRDPAMFTEDMEPRRPPRTGYAKDVNEVERYVRGFARRRPDATVTLLRCANVIGPRVVSPLASYFRLPVIPTVLGFDPRLQFRQCFRADHFYFTHSHSSSMNSDRGARHWALPHTCRTAAAPAGDGQRGSDWLSWRRFQLDHPHV